MTRLIVSFRAGDRLLGAENGTVAKLVAAGRLRPVPWKSGRRVTTADLERIAGEGILPDLRKPRATRAKPPPDDVADRIRRLPIRGYDS